MDAFLDIIAGIVCLGLFIGFCYFIVWLIKYIHDQP